MSHSPNTRRRWLIVILVLISPLLIWLGLIFSLMAIQLVAILWYHYPIVFFLLFILLTALYLWYRGKLLSTIQRVHRELERGNAWLILDWHKGDSRTRPVAAILAGVATFLLVMPVGATIAEYVLTAFFSVLFYLLQPFAFLSETTMESPFDMLLTLEDVVQIHLYRFFLPNLLCGLVFSLYIVILHKNDKLAAYTHSPLHFRSVHFGLIAISLAMILFAAGFLASLSDFAGLGIMILGYGVALIPGLLIAGRLAFSLMRTILYGPERRDD